MSKFSISVVEREKMRTAGLKVSTTYAKAAEDCPKLWHEEFGEHMAAFPADPAYPEQSYGVSVMKGPELFDYWAVMPLAKGVPVPPGMEELEIPGGLYAKVKLASLQELHGAFMYIYQEWPNAQTKYDIDCHGPSLEMYTHEFMRTGELTLYCPVKIKEQEECLK